MPRDTVPAPPLRYALVHVDALGRCEPYLVAEKERDATEFARAVPALDGEWRVEVFDEALNR